MSDWRERGQAELGRIAAEEKARKQAVVDQQHAKEAEARQRWDAQYDSVYWVIENLEELMSGYEGSLGDMNSSLWDSKGQVVSVPILGNNERHVGRRLALKADVPEKVQVEKAPVTKKEWVTLWDGKTDLAGNSISSPIGEERVDIRIGSIITGARVINERHHLSFEYHVDPVNQGIITLTAHECPYNYPQDEMREWDNIRPFTEEVYIPWDNTEKRAVIIRFSKGNFNEEIARQFFDHAMVKSAAGRAYKHLAPHYTKAEQEIAAINTRIGEFEPDPFYRPGLLERIRKNLGL